MPTFAVLGSGGWGTAIAVLLAGRPGNAVRLWSARPESAKIIADHRENTRQLPGVRIPQNVTVTHDEATATIDSDCWIVAVPTAFLRTTVSRFAPYARRDIPLVSLTKGIEADTLLRPSEILCSVLGSELVTALSGPSHAEEVARGMPTSVVVAGPDASITSWVQAQLGGERFRVYTSFDIIGVEFSGALKNVIGIAAGICDGLRFGDNAKAALLTRGLVEMRRFGVVHGADATTFAGLAGIGDLITTCFSQHGRNRRLGERIALGESLATVMSGPQVAEGVYTARSIHDRAATVNIELPIINAVYDILYQSKSPTAVVTELLSRQQRDENVFMI